MTEASRSSSRPPRGTSPTTPEAYPTTPPVLPSGDYSYTVEIVMNMQQTLGKLTEAVESLKEQSKEHGAEIRQIGKDVHAAKVVGGFIVVASTFLGLVIKLLVDYLKAK